MTDKSSKIINSRNIKVINLVAFSIQVKTLIRLRYLAADQHLFESISAI